MRRRRSSTEQSATQLTRLAAQLKARQALLGQPQPPTDLHPGEDRDAPGRTSAHACGSGRRGVDADRAASLGANCATNAPQTQAQQPSASDEDVAAKRAELINQSDCSRQMDAANNRRRSSEYCASLFSISQSATRCFKAEEAAAEDRFARAKQITNQLTTVQSTNRVKQSKLAPANAKRNHTPQRLKLRNAR